MHSKTLNLKTSAKDLCFFDYINYLFSELQKAKDKTKNSSVNGVYSIGDIENREICRGNTYAYFPELKDKEIKIQDLRDSLNSRGITSESFQNKIIFMMIQDRSGLPFELGNVFYHLFSHDNEFTEHQFQVEDRKFDMRILKNGHVSFYCTCEFSHEKAASDENKKPAFTIEYNFEISPEKVVVKDCNITKLTDEEYCNKIYDFIYKNQQNIISKIINYIKELLGFGVEYVIERSMPNDLIWSYNNLNQENNLNGYGQNSQNTSVSVGPKQ